MKTINTLKKVSLATFLTFVLSFSSVFAQNDTMYIMKSGAIAGQYNVNTEVDSVIFYKPTIEETTSGTFIDSRDGNEYNWVQIGDQVWMAENLAYEPSSGNYWAYDNNNSNVETYGYLYDWETACDVCPDGWHLPTDAEWTELTDYLGENAGGKLKATGTIEAGTGLWYDPNTGATNETGFTALPGGDRYGYGLFGGVGSTGYWWSATVSNTDYAWGRYVKYYDSNVGRYNYNKELGFSVRCLRD